jgi:TonB family protein
MKTLALAALVMFGASAGLQDPVYKAGDKGVKSPIVVSEKKPSYTPEAMRKKIQGSIELETVVTKEGKPTAIKVIRSLDKEYGLDKKAVDALQEWTFKPATKEGKAVAMKVKVEMTFTLRDKE